MATKNELLNELFFSLSCNDITDFCLRVGLFEEFECLADYNPQTLGTIINYLHDNRYDVDMYFENGMRDYFILCKKHSMTTYTISFLGDDNDQLTNALYFNAYILPILLTNRKELEWVVEHSKRKLTNVEKLLVGLGRQMEVTIKYTLNNVLDPKAECDAIREILGVDILLEENIVENFDISMKKA